MPIARILSLIAMLLQGKLLQTQSILVDPVGKRQDTKLGTWRRIKRSIAQNMLHFCSDCLFDLSIEIELRKKKMALPAVLTFCQSGLKV